MLVLMCVVLYSIWSRSLRLNYHSNQDELLLSAVNHRLSYIASLPLVLAIVFGLWQPKQLNEAIYSIISDGVEVSAEIAIDEVEVVVDVEDPEAMTGATIEESDTANEEAELADVESEEDVVNDENED
jgi:hypothetical protein